MRNFLSVRRGLTREGVLNRVRGLRQRILDEGVTASLFLAILSEFVVLHLEGFQIFSWSRAFTINLGIFRIAIRSTPPRRINNHFADPALS